MEFASANRLMLRRALVPNQRLQWSGARGLSDCAAGKLT
jgi:hypothetical protein